MRSDLSRLVSRTAYGIQSYCLTARRACRRLADIASVINVCDPDSLAASESDWFGEDISSHWHEVKEGGG